MSTELYDEPTEATRGPEGWRPPVETAPSQVRADEPKLARFLGMSGVSCLILGGFLLLLHVMGRPIPMGPAWGPIFATFLLTLGLGGVLLHAALDKDEQIRFLYMMLGHVLLAAGVVASLIPRDGVVGGYFLPWGILAFGLGLLFQLAYGRHETDEFYSRLTRQLIGGLGAVMALWGFGYGNVSLDFLLTQGLVLLLLGLVYLAVYVRLEGVGTDLGYRAALGMGLLGGLAAVIALGRAALLSWSKLGGDPGYHLMPGGLVLAGLGLLYVMISATLCSDNTLVVLTRREFVRFFYSPIAYFVLLGFSLIGWVLFMYFVFDPFFGLWQQGQAVPTMEPIVTYYIIDIFPIICVIFVVPVLTMGLLSEEQRTGTLEVMLTSPVNEPAVVVSKLLGALGFYLLIWLPWGLYLVALRWEGGQPFDYRPLIGFFVVLALTGVNFLSMGLFFSSVTRNQIIASVLTFAGMLMLIMPVVLERNVGPVMKSVLTHISFWHLWQNSLQGKVATRDVLFHVSVGVFWSFLTVKVLESRKWR